MKKLLRTLRKLDLTQFDRLSRYLQDPYSGPDSTTLKLFEYLHPHYPDFPASSFEDYASRLQPEAPDLTEFRLRCSYLLNRVYQFLAREALQRNEPQVDQALIESLLKIQEYSEADRQLTLANRRLSQKLPLDSNNYFAAVRLKDLALDLSFSWEMQQGQHDIPEYFESLDHLYVGLQLKYLLPALTLQRVYRTHFPTERWEFCRDKMETWGEQAPPLAQMAFHLIHLFLKSADGHYEKVLHLIGTYAGRISVTERQNIYGYLQNYLTQRLLQGDSEALKELFLLQQRMYQEKLIFGRGDYTEHWVRNLINVSCRLGEVQWARAFLTQNKPQIIESAGENVFAYVSAFQSFYAGDYSQALRLLQEVKVTAPQYRTGHQTLLLRIYFELHDSDSIEAVAETFRRYLNRSPHLSDRQKDLNRNFISVVQLLARSRDGGLNAYRKKRIAEYLQGNMGITDRTWLEEKFKGVLGKG